MTLENQKRLIALLIGITTIVAGTFAWRGGQLASNSAYQDRTSVGQTVKQQQLRVEAALGAIDDALVNVRYQADYAEAAAYDDRAAELEAQGQQGLAATFRSRAADLRLAATTRAVTAGVFGQQALYQDVARPTSEPRPFDFATQLQRSQTEVSSGITSPGPLDPDAWAAKADATRSRVRGLRWATLLLMLAVVLLTVAETSKRNTTRWMTASAAVLVLVAVSVQRLGAVW